MLQLEHRVGVEQVVLALATPLVFATDLELAVCALLGPVIERQLMACGDVGSDVVETDTTEVRAQPGEVLVDGVLIDADDLEQLRAGVGRQRRDAHLRHHLENALAGGLDVVLARGLVVEVAQGATHRHVLDGLEGHVGVDRRGTEAHERGHVVHLAGVTGLHQQADLGTGLFPHQVVVHRGDQQQRRDGCQGLVRLAVGQDNQSDAVRDGLGHLGTHGVERLAQAVAALGDRVETADLHTAVVGVLLVVTEVHELGEVVVVQDRLGQHDLAARLGPGIQQVGLTADAHADTGDHLFTDGVQRRVGDLREHLLEVVEQHAWALREHRERGVGTHRADGLGTGGGHR